MKKKLLLLVSSLMVFAAQAQKDTVITDIIHYYFNKHYFKTGKDLDSFPAYPSAAATVTNVTHVGSLFENDDTLTINGLEAFAAKHSMAAAQKVHLYLCHVDANRKPVLPAIDSVVLENINNVKYARLGGNFATPHVVTKDFAVLFRNMSTVSGDTMRLVRTNGKTLNNFNAPQNEKYSDGNGVVRYGGQFYSATNFTALGFGVGTDYEFCVAPRVEYSVHISQTLPQPIIDSAVICTWDVLTFVNNTTKRLSHRMYNLMEFRRHWDHNPPFHPDGIPDQPFPPERSAITWHFLAEDHILFYLPPGANSIDFSTDSSRTKADNPLVDDTTCFLGNQYRVRFKGIDYKGIGPEISYTEDFRMCTSYCGRDALGLSKTGTTGALSAFPNPVTDGRVQLAGLSGDSRVEVYNVTGQKVRTLQTRGTSAELNLEDLPPGPYLIKVQSGSSVRSGKVMKVN